LEVIMTRRPTSRAAKHAALVLVLGLLAAGVPVGAALAHLGPQSVPVVESVTQPDGAADDDWPW
jgi:hypothetical protein